MAEYVDLNTNADNKSEVRDLQWKNKRVLYLWVAKFDNGPQSNSFLHVNGVPAVPTMIRQSNNITNSVTTAGFAMGLLGKSILL